MDSLRSRNGFSLLELWAALAVLLGAPLACKKGDEPSSAETVAAAEKPALALAAAGTPGVAAPVVPRAPFAAVPAMPGAPSAVPGATVIPVAPDPTKPCTVLAASASHVAKVLGTGPLAGPRAEKTKWSHRCRYYGAEAITIDVDLDATATDFEALRKSAETAIKLPVKEHPGFGDKALSQVISTGTGPQAAQVNSLGVLKGKVLVYLASKASLEKIQALEADLLRDLGA